MKFEESQEKLHLSFALHKIGAQEMVNYLIS